MHCEKSDTGVYILYENTVFVAKICPEAVAKFSGDDDPKFHTY